MCCACKSVLLPPSWKNQSKCSEIGLNRNEGGSKLGEIKQRYDDDDKGKEGRVDMSE